MVSSKLRYPGQRTILFVLLLLSLRKGSPHVCVSGSSVGQSASLVVCNCMVPGSALGGMLAFLLLCAGLPTFVISDMHLTSGAVHRRTCVSVV